MTVSALIICVFFVLAGVGDPYVLLHMFIRQDRNLNFTIVTKTTIAIELGKLKAKNKVVSNI